MQLLNGETISLLEECSSVLDIQQCSFKGRVLSRSLAQGFPCGGGNIQPSSGGCWQGSDPGQKCEQLRAALIFAKKSQMGLLLAVIARASLLAASRRHLIHSLCRTKVGILTSFQLLQWHEAHFQGAEICP